MTTNIDPNALSSTPRAGRSLSRRRDDSGLTTLEWLLIVAAVAGLAALAVVLVTNVVGDTSEQISGSSARKTAAQVAGAEITNRARADVPALTTGAFVAKAAEYQDDCNRLKITYADVEDLMVAWTYTNPATFTAATWSAALDDPTMEGCVVT